MAFYSIILDMHCFFHFLRNGSVLVAYVLEFAEDQPPAEVARILMQFYTKLFESKFVLNGLGEVDVEKIYLKVWHT